MIVETRRWRWESSDDAGNDNTEKGRDGRAPSDVVGFALHLTTALIVVHKALVSASPLSLSPRSLSGLCYLISFLSLQALVSANEALTMHRFNPPTTTAMATAWLSSRFQVERTACDKSLDGTNQMGSIFERNGDC